jgi:hypothetical protein
MPNRQPTRLVTRNTACGPDQISDLVILEGNPAEDVLAVADVRMVIGGGAIVFVRP